MTTWREELNREMAPQTTDDLIACTLTEEQMDKEFDAGYGGTEGQPFTAWTSTTVYFPMCYDGREWAGSAPRNPTKKAFAQPLEHQGDW